MACRFGANAAASLLVELVELGSLDVAHVGDGDHYGVVGIEVLGIELVVEGDDFRSALVAVLLLHFLQLVFHHLLAALGVVEDFLQVGNELHQVVVLLVQLVYAQAGELCQSHVDNGLRL